MIRFIVKRDGRKVSFNQLKIANAIRKALKFVHPDDGITEHEELLIKNIDS